MINQNRDRRRAKTQTMRLVSKVLVVMLTIVTLSIVGVITVQTVRPDGENEPITESEPAELSSQESVAEEEKPLPEKEPEEEEKEEEKVNFSNLSEEDIKILRENGKPKIAFTFDDGPMQNTSRLLNCLEKYQVGSTFFILGINAKQYPDEIKRMGEMGLDVQNHSYKHTKLKDDNKAEFLKEIEKTSNFVLEHTGRPTNLVRLPGGAFGYSDEFLSTLPFPIMNWTIDTKDWKHKDVETTVNSILSEARDGAVVLIHDPYLPTIEAIERVIPLLLEKGYDIVSLSDLAAIKGVELENGKVYTGFY